MRIAVIGTGIAGLSAVHHLVPHHRADRVELSIFEADRRTGGHANTVEVESERGAEHVDTGFIVFNRRNYPVFDSILEQLEVPSRPSNMSFSVSDGRDFEYTGRNLAGLFANRRHVTSPEFLRMLAEVPLLQRRLRGLIRTGDETTLEDFLEQEGFSRLLREKVVLPMVASVWSAGEEASRFPARFLARFLDNHGLLNIFDRPRWRSVEGGSRAYVERLLAPVADRVRIGAAIEAIYRAPDGVRLKAEGRTAERFDQVILAVHAPDAAFILRDADHHERRFLAAFPYQRNEVVLHTDQAVMPVRTAAWASWNYRIGAGRQGLTALTYDMNRLQSLDCRRRFFVSLNMGRLIDPARVIRRFTYEHPVFSPQSIEAQADWESVSGRGGVHFAGAWLRNGFHEDGAMTGQRAAAAALANWVGGPELALAA